jgi:DNA-binding response OmpR family regulator
MKKILIIENRNSIKNMVNLSDKMQEFKIFSFEDFVSNSTIKENIYDLIIADLTSIKNEKVELLLQLKESIKTSFVPFLLIISKNGNKAADQLSTFNYYITKPFSKTDLLSTIKKILNNKDLTSPW